MGYKEEFNKWSTDPYFDEDTRAELANLLGNEKEIEDRFYRSLEFGTGGLRGVIGAGTNRMNIYTVRQATQGLANYIVKQGAQDKGVAIAFDSRIMSLRREQPYALMLMVLRHIDLIHFVLLQNYHLQLDIWVVQQE